MYTISNKEIVEILRNQAWQRAKGELNSMLHTFYGSREKFELLNNAIQDFIQTVEDNGLQE